ncbi:MAG: M14 family metallopeptidase [Phycisphaerae bacterium]
MSLYFFRSGIKLFFFLFALISLLTMAAQIAPAAEYHNNKSLTKLLASLAEQNPELVRLDNIARSIGKRRVWLVEVGKGTEQDRKIRPAMLVVAGIEGNDLAGSSIAVSWIKHLLEQYETDAEITKLLQTTTFYIIPRINPDAAEHFFNEPKCETSRNDKPVDDDHDGLLDEDGPEDLNGDGLITSMRIEDPEGEYILDPADDRLLMKADPLKSEVGAWRYLTEGIDNDHDESWNEDGPGGVNFNRNFPYNFEFFAPDAGVHQVSQPETRALADFVIEHPNIGIIMTYGAADNLLKTQKGAPPPDRRKPMTGIDEDDAGYYKAMGELYRKALGLDKELEDISCPGTFSDWMYFHRGRISLAARPWSPALAVELSKAAEKKKQAGDEKDSESELENEKKDKDKSSKDDKDKRNEKERQELKWFDENSPQAFVKWQAIEHPDFPNQRVEVGGYSPFALTNPPAQMLEQIAAKNADFLTMVAQRLPRIAIRKIESRHLGQSVYEVKIQVENTGFLPTSLAHGRTTREIYPTRLVIELDDRFFLSGTRITNLPVLQGSGGMEELRYIIRALDRKKIDFKVISMLAGQVTGTIELKNAE